MADPQQQPKPDPSVLFQGDWQKEEGFGLSPEEIEARKQYGPAGPGMFVQEPGPEKQPDMSRYAPPKPVIGVPVAVQQIGRDDAKYMAEHAINDPNFLRKSVKDKRDILWTINYNNFRDLDYRKQLEAARTYNLDIEQETKRKRLTTIPAITSTIGALGGEYFGGPGGAVAGAGIGGFIGKGMEQYFGQSAGLEDQQTLAQNLADMGIEGGIQAANEFLLGLPYRYLSREGGMLEPTRLGYEALQPQYKQGTSIADRERPVRTLLGQEGRVPTREEAAEGAVDPRTGRKIKLDKAGLLRAKQLNEDSAQAVDRLFAKYPGDVPAQGSNGYVAQLKNEMDGLRRKWGAHGTRGEQFEREIDREEEAFLVQKGRAPEYVVRTNPFNGHKVVVPTTLAEKRMMARDIPAAQMQDTKKIGWYAERVKGGKAFETFSNPNLQSEHELAMTRVLKDQLEDFIRTASGGRIDLGAMNQTTGAFTDLEEQLNLLVNRERKKRSMPWLGLSGLLGGGAAELANYSFGGEQQPEWAQRGEQGLMLGGGVLFGGSMLRRAIDNPAVKLAVARIIANSRLGRGAMQEALPTVGRTGQYYIKEYRYKTRQADEGEPSELYIGPGITPGAEPAPATTTPAAGAQPTPPPAPRNPQRPASPAGTPPPQIPQRRESPFGGRGGGAPLAELPILQKSLPNWKPEYREIMRRTAAQTPGVPLRALISVAQQENAGGDTNFQNGPTGGIGLMQVVKSTGQTVSGNKNVDLRDPTQNIPVGALYLKQLQDRFGYDRGNRWKVLAGYRTGPENVPRTFDQLDENRFPGIKNYVRNALRVWTD
jgi:soluble lytic murein transglycosylase-like protein